MLILLRLDLVLAMNSIALKLKKFSAKIILKKKTLFSRGDFLFKLYKFHNLLILIIVMPNPT